MRIIDPNDIAAALRSPEIDAEWRDAEPGIIQPLAGIVGVGSTNPGDRRALFYLMRWLKARNVLEIGTNIGGSTLAIAGALRLAMAQGAGRCALTTVDKSDCNEFWRGKPRDNIAAMGMSEHVAFVVARSGDFLTTTREQYDFAFIDGSHDAPHPYQDVTGAVGCLDPDGVIVLHDYFPGGQPLWADGKVIEGPYLAVERLRREGAGISVIPLGELPWPTKQGSNVTSLAVLTRAA